MSFLVNLLFIAVAQAQPIDIPAAQYVDPAKWAQLKAWFEDAAQRQRRTVDLNVVGDSLSRSRLQTRMFQRETFGTGCSAQEKRMRESVNELSERIQTGQLRKNVDRLMSLCPSHVKATVGQLESARRRVLATLDVLEKKLDPEMKKFTGAAASKTQAEYESKLAQLRQSVVDGFRVRYAESWKSFQESLAEPKSTFTDEFRSENKPGDVPEFWLSQVRREWLAITRSLEQLCVAKEKGPDRSVCSAEIVRLHTLYEKSCRAFESRMSSYFELLGPALENARALILSGRPEEITGDELNAQAKRLMDIRGERPLGAEPGKPRAATLKVSAPVGNDGDSQIEACIGTALGGESGPWASVASKRSSEAVVCSVLMAKSGQRMGEDTCSAARTTQFAKEHNREWAVSLPEEKLFFGGFPNSERVRTMRGCVSYDARAQLPACPTQLARDYNALQALSDKYSRAEFIVSTGVLRVYPQGR